jgi:predicted type IV restriction endonuclease
MDFSDRIRDMAMRVSTMKAENLKTEEAAKTALIMPFMQILGFDIFNPLEVTPELVADVGVKKGEKVDYAILKDGKPIMLFECKSFGVDLNKVHASQLYRYFSVTPVRFGILTNGIAYRFYSDLVAANKMDDAPFFVFDLSSYNETHLETLKRFTKAAFDQEANIQVASNLKYRNAVKIYLETLFIEPSEAFVKFVVKESKAYEGHLVQSVVSEFKGIIHEAMANFLREQVDKRLKSALDAAEQKPQEVVATAQQEPEADTQSEENKIVTTQEELDAYFAVKSIVRECVEVKRVTFRDAQSYANVLVDNNNRKLLCRLYFNGKKKYIGIIDGAKTEQRHMIESVDDIYKHASELTEAAMRLIE